MMVLNVTTLSQGGVMLMLFVIYVCHLPVSVSCTSYFRGVSSWWGCLFDVIHDLCTSFASK